MITCQDLNFGYTRRRPLFKQLSLKLEAGHIHGIFGANGTGKSTLLKLVSGLLQPQAGEATLFTKNSFMRSPSQLRELIFIPEEFTMPRLTLHKYGELYGAFYPRFSANLLQQYAEQFAVGLHEQLNHLSMGQCKKALICFGLACQPTVLLMDEPTNGLDIPSKAVFRRLIAGFASEERCVAISTHQVRDLEQLIDNVVMLNNTGIMFNYPLSTLSEKLLFRAIRAEDTPLYMEDGMTGMRGIVPNNGGEEREVDLEMLFIAMSQPAENKAILKILHP